MFCFVHKLLTTPPAVQMHDAAKPSPSSPFLCAFSLASCAAFFSPSCFASSSACFLRSSSCSCSFFFFSRTLAASSCISRISALISCRARSATVMSSKLGKLPWNRQNTRISWVQAEIRRSINLKNLDVNRPLQSFAPPPTPGSTAGSLWCCRSWGWPVGGPSWSGWRAQAAGWAAGSPPGCCWGYAVSPCPPPAFASRVLPPEDAAALPPSAVGWRADGQTKSMNSTGTR